MLCQKRPQRGKKNRRARRFRLRRGPKGFDNRKRKDGWIAPSQEAKVSFRIRIIAELCKEPITIFVIEDVKFDHYEKRWGKHFSTVEIGKKRAYGFARKEGKLVLYEGWQTKEAREKFGIPKSNNKSKLDVTSHASDALAMASLYFGKKPNVANCQFLVWKRYSPDRRSLHLRQFSKGGIRERRGGTVLIPGYLYKGDVVEGVYKGQKVTGVACSITEKQNKEGTICRAIGVATFEKKQRWIVSGKTVRRIYHNNILTMYGIHPPLTSGGILP